MSAPRQPIVRLVIAFAVTIGMLAVAATSSAAWSTTPGRSSNAVSAATLAAPSGATLSIPFGCVAPRISWIAAAGAASYRVDRQLGTDPWTTVNDNVSTGTTWNDTSPLPTSFAVRYRVSSRLHPGSWSSDTSSTVSEQCAGTPTLSATHTPGTTNLSWTATTSATGYDLERRVGGGSWTRIASAQTARTFTDAATLTDGASVAYRVRGVGAAGATTSWSELATIIWNPVAPTFTVARTITSD
ncbi:MAG: hypothetical protein ABI200_01135, partial [Gaiellales bacterium]